MSRTEASRVFRSRRPCDAASTARPWSYVVVGLAVVLLACGSSESSTHRAPKRHYVRVQWDTVWERRPSASDTLIQYPTRIGGDGRFVFVVDAGARRLVALRGNDGSLAWSRQTADDGLPLFDEVAAMAIDVHGNVLLADSHQGFLVLVDASGVHARRMSLRGIPFIVSMCPLRDETLVIQALHSPPLMRMRLGDSQAVALPFPWKDASELEPLAFQGLLSPLTGRAQCVLALGLGRGFATVGIDSAGRPKPYIETLELPQVVTSSSWNKNQRTDVASLAHRQIAALGVSVAGGEITIPFVGATRAVGQIIDIYAEDTGDYLRSLLFPRNVTDLVRVRSIYYGIEAPNGVVLAATPRAIN